MTNKNFGTGSWKKILSPNFTSLSSLVRTKSDDRYTYNLIVFRNILKPLIWTLILRLIGSKNIKLIYRANNDPLHWIHERSITRAISEFAKVLILPHYDLVIYNSFQLEKRCRHYNKNHAVLPNPIKSNDHIHFQSKNKNILYIGRDAKQKNIRSLLASMAMVDKSIKLTVIGFENTHYFASSNVEFIRWSKCIDYKKFSYIALPSFYEGSPNALLEGLNNGLIPIITPFKSGGSELIEAFKCHAFIAPDFSASAIYLAITNAMNTEVDLETCTPNQLRFDYFACRLQDVLKNV